MRRVVGILLILAGLLTIAQPVSGQSGPVLDASIQGEITRATVDYVQAAIESATAQDARAIVFRMDTPGGGLQETLAIQKMFTESPVPIIGWVAPSGVSAWSAGTILLVSTDLAAMAPFTTIGSVQPVSATGEPVTDSKIIEAVVGSLEAHLNLHGRNVTLATEFVVRNLNLNATEAKDARAIELIATDMNDLLAQADGFELHYRGETLHVAGARVVVFEAPAGVAFLSIIANPVISGLLLLLGIYAIIFGVSAPGHGAEIAGIIMIALGLLGLGFSVNLVSVFLLGVGIVLLLIEVFTPGFGVFGGAGIVCVAIATVFLAPVAPPNFLLPAETQQIIIAALLTPTAAFGVFLLFAMYKVMKIRRKKPTIGEILGEQAKTIDAIPAGGRGYVRFQGEMWLSTSREDLGEEEVVYITAKEGIVLTVARAPPDGTVTARPKFRFGWRTRT